MKSDWAFSGMVDILTYLLPGFVAAVIFYSLTSHPKPGGLDRVIQALIFTAIIQAVVQPIEGKLGNIEAIASIMVAIILGVITAWLSNKDIAHGILRKIGITRETSHPSEWYSSFARNKWYIVLHLTGQRRLYGFPVEWPSNPEKGHFRIAEAEWLVEEERKPITGVENILISYDEVEMVEFMSKENPQLQEN